MLKGFFQNSSLFLPYAKIEEEIQQNILKFGEKNRLRDACEYALKGGGKRFRPLLVLLIAEALGHSLCVIDAALSVEFFHTASLIVDDLPCMDDEEKRREQPTLHRAFEEPVALLASYALICAAFEKIYANTVRMKSAPAPFNGMADIVGSLSLEHLSRSAGIAGATGGQFYDLFPQSLTFDSLREVIHRKTAMLFEVSCALGWLFGGGGLQFLEKVKKMGYHFGMAFQIADDLNDMCQDELRQRQNNLAVHLGSAKAFLFFEEECNKFREVVKELAIETPALCEIADKLCQLVVQ